MLRSQCRCYRGEVGEADSTSLWVHDVRDITSDVTHPQEQVMDLFAARALGCAFAKPNFLGY